MLFATGARGVAGVDAIGANLDAAAKANPGKQLCTYATGTGDVPASPAQIAAHPGILLIDQTPGGDDPRCDYFDIEFDAGTIARAPSWYREALTSFENATRPGQRHPGLYVSASNVTALVNGLIAGGVTSGPGLIIANWNLSEPQALADVLNARGPFPIVGIQYADPGKWDDDVWSEAWLGEVSGAHRTVHTTDGTETIGQIATSRNMTPIGWAGYQQAMRPLDANDLVGSAVPAAGHQWWSR